MCSFTMLAERIYHYIMLSPAKAKINRLSSIQNGCQKLSPQKQEWRRIHHIYTVTTATSKTFSHTAK